MTSRPVGLFDQEIRQRKLQAPGDPLEELDRIVPWGMFRQTLEAIRNEGCGLVQVWSPPHDAVRMFKVLVRHKLHRRTAPRDRSGDVRRVQNGFFKLLLYGCSLRASDFGAL